MRRREILGLFGSGPLAMAALNAAEAGEDQPATPRIEVDVRKDPRTSCFEQCEDLAKFCLILSDQLLNDLKEGRGAAESIARLHRAIADSREFCSLVVTMVLRNSPFRAPSCLACAEVCEHCAKLAGTTIFEHKIQAVEQFKECAAICREVARLHQ